MSDDARILPFPFAPLLAGGQLEAFQIKSQGEEELLIVDYYFLQPAIPPELIWRDERPYEQFTAYHIPQRIVFHDVRWFKWSGLYPELKDVPTDHPVRSLRAFLSWTPPQSKEQYHLLINGAGEQGGLLFTAGRAEFEVRPGLIRRLPVLRGWTPPPPLRPGPVPDPVQLRRHYGGDPVAIHLADGAQERQLFIGSLEEQSAERPAVDIVLNLGEQASKWVAAGQGREQDRWAEHGEGRVGMRLTDIQAEAAWVLKHLTQGDKVLVHCVAGFNRSATVCCAVLMMLEGLTAVAALDRIRQHHPWCQPDSHHWLILRWLEQQLADSTPSNSVGR